MQADHVQTGLFDPGSDGWPAVSQVGAGVPSVADSGLAAARLVTGAAGKRVVAVIPAYNEDRFIGSVVLKTRDHVDEVIVVDDGSVDRTAAIAGGAGALVISHVSNEGKAAALRTGLCEAYNRGADVAVLLDGDGQHDPAEIPFLVRPILAGIADIVAGSRFLNVKSEIPAWRRVGQHALTTATNLASGTHCSDSQTGFRALSCRALELFECSSKGFAVESEMQFCAAENDLRIVEVPIGCIYAERAKRNPVKHGLQVLDGIVSLISQTRPLLAFGASGLFLVIAGAGAWCWVVRRYDLTGELAVGYALVATLLVVLGTLGAFQGLVLHMLRKMNLQLAERLMHLLTRGGVGYPAGEGGEASPGAREATVRRAG
jgi:hypothetical protein